MARKGFASQMKDEVAQGGQAAASPAAEEQQEGPDENQAEGASGERSEAGASQGGGQNLTPQEQEQMKQAIDIGTQLLYQDQKTSSAVGRLLKQAAQQNVVPQAVGDATATLVRAVDQRMNDQLSDTLIVPLGMVLLDHVLSMGEQLGLFKADPKILEGATQAMNARLAKLYGGGQQQAPAQPQPQSQPGAAPAPAPAPQQQPQAGVAPAGAQA